MPTRPTKQPMPLALVPRILAAALFTTIALGNLSIEVRAQSPSPATQPSYKVGQLVIEAPWLRATPQGAKVAAGYLKVTNFGQEPDRLIGGSLPIANSVAVHEMVMANGTMKMRKLPMGLEIKPGQTVELKPGSYHLMFEGLREAVKAGKPLKGTVNFEKAGSVEVAYHVAPIGAQTGSAMKPGDHMKH